MNGDDRDIMKMIGMRHGFNNLSTLKMHMKPINPNHHFSQSNVVSVLDHPIKIENDSMFFEDIKDDKRFAIDPKSQFKFNYTNVNNDTEDIIVENTIKQENNSVPEPEKKNIEIDKVVIDKVDCQSEVESENVSEKVVEIKEKKKEVKIVKVIKKEKKLDKKPPIPKPKEEKPKEEKHIERLNMDDLVVEKKTEGIK